MRNFIGCVLSLLGIAIVCTLLVIRCTSTNFQKFVDGTRLSGRFPRAENCTHFISDVKVVQLLKDIFISEEADKERDILLIKMDFASRNLNDNSNMHPDIL